MPVLISVSIDPESMPTAASAVLPNDASVEPASMSAPVARPLPVFESIRADNACFEAARRPGVTLAIHLCRGNNRSHWYAEGGYDAIAERLFGELRVDRFLLEYDDERSGGFEPLRQVPSDRTVVLGLVSSKTAALESKDELKQRIKQASAMLPLDRLALSPQCGFASTMEGNLVTGADQEAKLRLVAETAREVWGGQVGTTRLRA